MDRLARVLDERAGDLAVGLTMVGFSQDEARRFLVEAGAELMHSYQWQAAAFEGGGLATDEAASKLLGGMRGRALAHQMGLSPEKTWAGLRELVPAVLEASFSDTRAGGRKPSGARPDRPSRMADFTAFDFGFGLSLDGLRTRGGKGRGRDGGGGQTVFTHPVFGRLLPIDD